MSSTVIAKTVAIPTDSSDTIQGRSSRKRVDAYRSSHKRVICNVHAFFEQEKRDGPIMLESVQKERQWRCRYLNVLYSEFIAK